MNAGTVTRPARWRLAAAAGGLTLLAVACGSGSSPASGGAPTPAAPSSPAPAAGGPSPGSALCPHAAALSASLIQLTHVKIEKGMKNEITANLADAKENLAAFVSAAHGQWQAQTAALKSALTDLQTEATSLTGSPSASAVGGVVSTLQGVSTAAQNLLAAVSTRCPSASPSPSG